MGDVGANHSVYNTCGAQPLLLQNAWMQRHPSYKIICWPVSKIHSIKISCASLWTKKLGARRGCGRSFCSQRGWGPKIEKNDVGSNHFVKGFLPAILQLNLSPAPSYPQSFENPDYIEICRHSIENSFHQSSSKTIPPAPSNPWFYRNLVMRLWSQAFYKRIIACNPPAKPFPCPILPTEFREIMILLKSGDMKSCPGILWRGNPSSVVYLVGWFFVWFVWFPFNHNLL